MLIGFFDLLQQDSFYLAECGKTKRNQMNIQLFLTMFSEEFKYTHNKRKWPTWRVFFFTRVENINFSGPVHSELSLYLLRGSQILYPGRLGWDERCEHTILSVFATISMINHYWSSDVVRLQRGRDSFLFVDVCFFMSVAIHTFMSVSINGY